MLYAQTATRTYTWSDAAIAVSDRICIDAAPKASSNTTGSVSAAHAGNTRTPKVPKVNPAALGTTKVP